MENGQRRKSRDVGPGKSAADRPRWKTDLLAAAHTGIVFGVVGTLFALLKLRVAGRDVNLSDAVFSYGAAGLISGVVLALAKRHADSRLVCVSVGAVLGALVLVLWGRLAGPLSNYHWGVILATAIIGAVVGAYTGDNVWYKQGMKSAGRFFRPPDP